MWNDVVELRDFYNEPLGQVARRMIRRQVRAIWPNVTGMNVVGIGYANPFLRPFLADAARVVTVMPPRQGVVHWPAEGPGRVVLADEAELPFPDRSIDRLIMVHALECTEQLRPMMREIWRVLADGGRLLVVAPNRRSLWARLERTPFGHGRPYTFSQLSRVMRETMFTPMQTARALYVPPSVWRLTLHAASAWERVGTKWFSQFSGVLLQEAAKDVYAVIPQPERKRYRRPVLLPTPQAAATYDRLTRSTAGKDEAAESGEDPDSSPPQTPPRTPPVSPASA